MGKVIAIFEAESAGMRLSPKSLKTKTNKSDRQIRIQLYKLIIVICLLLAFALVGHILFMARGIYDCSEYDCAICVTVQGVMSVAGQSSTTAAAMFVALFSIVLLYARHSMADSVWSSCKTPITYKIRMNN